MFHDQRLVRATLQAAVRHAKTHGGSNPRDCTIFFVRTVLVDLKKRRWYDNAYTVAMVLRKLEFYSTVLDAALELGLTAADFKSMPRTDEPPTSNTGVTPRLNLHQSALEDYLNG